VATVTGLHPESRFGVLEVDERSLVRRFREKPRLDGLISGGFFVFSRRVFDYLDDDEDCVLEQKPLRRMADEGQMAVYQHEGFWKSMDTYRDFQEFNKLWERGETPWRVW
jgi:glucose-1-phosphate cytidylyltransferase